MKTDEELFQIAKDIFHGRIFTDRHLHDPNDARMVFMPLGLADKKMINKLIEDNVTLIYEYLEKAGPRSCNGMPLFYSMQVLTKLEHKKVDKIFDKLNEANKKVEEEILK